MLMIAADGWDELRRRSKRKRAFSFILKITASAWVLCTVAWMICVHPWQNMFFNVLAGNPNNRFELDYWHVAEADALRHIAARDAGSGEIASVARSETNYFVIKMLDDKEISRINIVPAEEFCRYFVFFAPPQWHIAQGGLPFKAAPDAPTSVKVIHEKFTRSSLFLHPVFIYRIYEFSTTSKTCQ